MVVTTWTLRKIYAACQHAVFEAVQPCMRTQCVEGMKRLCYELMDAQKGGSAHARAYCAASASALVEELVCRVDQVRALVVPGARLFFWRFQTHGNGAFHTVASQRKRPCVMCP